MGGDDATVFLERLRAGDAAAGQELFRLVYAELHALAGRVLSGADAARTLQPTALVHEAYLRMVASKRDAFENRSHFMGVAARAMRSVLVDHVRSKRTQKRGGAANRVPLDDLVLELEQQATDLLALDEALVALAELDADLARLVEVRFFGGLSIAEAAKVLGVSTATVERDWRTARLWLRERLA
jgi:RNA polymerase sigma factor (TIGR02999 family)